MVYVFSVFFFFKQKTAYEMRISDWSSDVCSSDLIMQIALGQAKQGRLHILGEMAKALTAPRPELSDFAPRLITLKIHPDKIREVIGKGGSVIQGITQETGTQIDIQDDGTIPIASANSAAVQAAKARIAQITSDVEPGRLYEGQETGRTGGRE